MYLNRYNPKVDLNQREIVDALRAVGASVEVMNHVGHGFPDLLIGKNGKMFLAEIKQPGKNLRPNQKEWAAQWRGPKPHLIINIDEALRILSDETE